MKICIFPLVLLASLAIYSEKGITAPTEGEPSGDVPELAVLDYLQGSFRIRVALPAKTVGKGDGKWKHQGRFLTMEWSSQASDASPAINGTIVTTYDVAQKKYRQWSFDSTGTVFESVGSWDEESKTMTWTGTSNGLSHTWRQTVKPDGSYEWNIKMRDQGGDVVYETRGVTSPLGKR